MPLQPRAWIGLVCWLTYVVIIVAIQRASGVPYTEWGTSASNLWRGALISILVGGVVLAGISLRLGWFSAAMVDRRRSGAGWALIAPGLYMLVALGSLAATRWDRLSADYLLAAAGLALAVGFAEEFVCWGVLLVGLRGSMRELLVWLLTCTLFGAMHVNAVAPTTTRISTSGGSSRRARRR